MELSLRSSAFAVALCLVLIANFRMMITADRASREYSLWFQELSLEEPMTFMNMNNMDDEVAAAVPRSKVRITENVFFLLRTGNAADQRWSTEDADTLVSNDEDPDEYDDDQHQKVNVVPKRRVNIEVDERFRRIRIILLRSIGNPLPPRHNQEQAYDNLKFTLENEPDFPDLVKFWVLNRLIDKSLEERLQSLITSYGYECIVIPFNLTEYASVQYRFDYYDPGGDVVHSPTFVKRKMTNKLYNDIEDAVNQDKSIFVTNQNAARNIMIDFGQTYSRDIDWIMPWDGNCYLNVNGYEAIYRQLQAIPPSHKYAITYMNRAISNEDVLKDSYRPNATEEPQILFRRTARGRFHPLLRYGRMNKSELLQRLKIAGVWDTWAPLLDWEVQHLGPFLQPVPDLQNITKDGPVRATGYVTRLSSGKPDLEADGASRHAARFESMKALLGQLDTRVAIELYGFRPGQLVFYHEEALERDRQLFLDEDVLASGVVEDLRQLALAAVTFGPWSVTDKPDDLLAASGDKHDYIDLAPYVWSPSPDELENPILEGQRRDGEAVPPTPLNISGSEHYDGIRIQEMQRNTTILGLAYFMTGEAQFAEAAARNIRCWFLDPETRMNPNIMYGHVVPSANGNKIDSSGIMGMKDVYFILDAIRIIERDGFLTEAEQSDLRAWFSDYLKWLETSPIGMLAYSSRNHVAIYFDVQAIAIAAYLNDIAKMIWYSERSTSRLRKQVADDGSMPMELHQSYCDNYQLALQGWSILSRIAETVHRNRWTVTTNETKSTLPLLCKAAEHSIPFYGRSTGREGVADSKEDGTRWWPLLQDSRYYCQMLHADERQWPIPWFQKGAPRPPRSSYEMPSVYHTDYAIAPFWNLGLVHGNITWVSIP